MLVFDLHGASKLTVTAPLVEYDDSTLSILIDLSAVPHVSR